MNIKEATNKLTKEQIENAEDGFNVGTGVVFFSDQFMQPIYVTAKRTRGLNANSKEDRAIIRAAQKAQKEVKRDGR